MAIHSQIFAIITNRLIVKCWKKWNIPTKFGKNRTKPGNPYYLVLFENCTKRGLPVVVLIVTFRNLRYIHLAKFVEYCRMWVFYIITHILHPLPYLKGLFKILTCFSNIVIWQTVYNVRFCVKSHILHCLPY